MRIPGEKRSVIVLGDRFQPERLEQLLIRHGWKRYASESTGEGERQITEEIWSNLEQTQAVHYVDDRTMRTRYLWVRGQEIMSIASLLVGHFHIHPADELLSDVADAETTVELEQALLHLAVGNRGPLDGDALETFRYFAADPRQSVRYTIIQSLLFTGWPEGREILEEMKAREADPYLLEFASEAAQAVAEGRAGP
jgi:hypothetical protein